MKGVRLVTTISLTKAEIDEAYQAIVSDHIASTVSGMVLEIEENEITPSKAQKETIKSMVKLLSTIPQEVQAAYGIDKSIEKFNSL